MSEFSNYLALGFRECSTPLYKASEWLYEASTPLDLENKRCELIERIAKVSAAALLLIPALMLHAVGLIGRGAQILVSSKPYLERGNYNPSSQAKKICIGIYNMNLFPGPMPTLFGGVEPGTKRLAQLADDVQNARLDVVCIAEGHDNKHVAKIHNILLQRGEEYNLLYAIGDRPFKFNSGLAILSKYPIEEMEFHPFLYEERQKMINKGFVSCKINGVRVIATHLDPANENVRRLELEEITRYQQQFTDPVVLLGDMNIKKGSDEYESSQLKSEYQSSYVESKPSCNDEILMAKRRGEKPPKQEDDIDYILVPNRFNTKTFTTTLAVETNDNPNQAHSDHAFKVSDIEIS
ncbi:MAG: endonuclease/exonuclease/phosphatase family protein [Chlamydiia bacterium]|nr:endonuclease/exonuclease/phosphatase family protein [Chlamydiia bacterium]